MTALTIDVVYFGGLALVLAIIAYGAFYFRLRGMRQREQPRHVSETAAGAKRHEDRMSGLRALAEGIEGERPPGENAPAEASQPQQAEVDDGW